MIYVNLTQHKPTEEQLSDGMFTPPEHSRIKELLNVTYGTSDEDYQDNLDRQAKEILTIVEDMPVTWQVPVSYVVGGHPSLVSRLAELLTRHGYRVVVSFSDRVSVETMNDNGEVVKTSVFKHIGFRPF